LGIFEFCFQPRGDTTRLYEAQEVLQMIGTLLSQELGNQIPN